MLYVTNTIREVARNSSTLLIFLSPQVGGGLLPVLFIGNFQENLNRGDQRS